MSYKNLKEILSSGLSPAEMELAIQRLNGQVSKAEAQSLAPTHAALDEKGRYVLRSVLTAVKPSVSGNITRLVPCESDDPEVCGRFMAVFGHALQQRNKQLVLSPLSEFVNRSRPNTTGQRGELQQRNLSWVVGGWALIGEQRLGGTGPGIPFAFHGMIGDNQSSLSGRESYTVKVDPGQATVEESLRLTVESLLAGLWGHNGNAELFGDAPSAIETATACSRIGRFGITVDRQSTGGPKFVQNGEVVEAKAVTGVTGRRRDTQTETTGDKPTGGSNFAKLAAEARALRAQAQKEANG